MVLEIASQVQRVRITQDQSKGRLGVAFEVPGIRWRNVGVLSTKARQDKAEIEDIGWGLCQEVEDLYGEGARVGIQCPFTDVADRDEGGSSNEGEAEPIALEEEGCVGDKEIDLVVEG